MIEEIIFLKNKGLSFRRIANEMNSTVGKVQYQWTKWMSQQSDVTGCNDVTLHNESKETKYKKSGLSITLEPDKKLKIDWCLSEADKHLITSYFGEDIKELVHLIRIYDVTGITFNGHNEHRLYEISVPSTHQSWTVKGLLSERDYMAEFGVLLVGDKYFPILRSWQVLAMPESGRLESTKEGFHVKSLPKWNDHVSTYTYYQKYLIEREEGYGESGKKR